MTTNPVSVRGGPGGISAHCEDMESTSALFGRVATDTADHVLSLHTYLVQPQVLESTMFDPLGAARFEARLAGALDGAAGVTALAVRAAALGAGLRAAAEAYRSTDRLDRLIAPEVNFVRNLPRAGWDAVGVLTTTGDVQAAAQRWLSDEPQAADLAMGSAAGFVAGASIPASLRLIGRLYPDGTAQVTTLGLTRRLTVQAHRGRSPPSWQDSPVGTWDNPERWTCAS